MAKNDVKNTTQKIKDQAKRTPLKTGDEPRCSRKVNSSCSTSDDMVFIILHVSYQALVWSNPGAPESLRVPAPLVWSNQRLQYWNLLLLH
jgi:hypothetical protein